MEEQLKTAVAEFLHKAEAADQADLPDRMNIPEELSQRTERLKAIADAKADSERRAAERYVLENEAYDRRLAECAEKEQKAAQP